VAEKTRAEQERENAQKAKAKDEENDEVVPRPGDAEYVPEEDREFTTGELEARLAAAEAHERLYNQTVKDEVAAEKRRENIEQGPELADEAREELEADKKRQVEADAKASGVEGKARKREKDDDAQREAHGDSTAQRQATGQKKS